VRFCPPSTPQVCMLRRPVPPLRELARRSRGGDGGGAAASGRACRCRFAPSARGAAPGSGRQPHTWASRRSRRHLVCTESRHCGYRSSASPRLSREWSSWARACSQPSPGGQGWDDHSRRRSSLLDITSCTRRCGAPASRVIARTECRVAWNRSREPRAKAAGRRPCSASECPIAWTSMPP
jgi:hypothetical protein